MRNPGYVHEIAAMVLRGELSASSAKDLLEGQNGGSAGLEQATEDLRSMSTSQIQDRIRELYVADGAEHGYCSTETTESVWVLGQRAHAHYDGSA